MIAPSTALLAPASPDPAPRGTTGTPCRVATCITATTSAVLRGSTTAAGVPGRGEHGLVAGVGRR